MLDPKEIDKILNNLSITIVNCNCDDSLELWMDSTFCELVEFGSIYMYTEDFMPDNYYEVLQLMIRFYEKAQNYTRVAVCIKLQKEFLKERNVPIAKYIIQLALNFLHLKEQDKYN